MTNVFDYNVRLKNLADLEDFSQAIKDAVAARMASKERFSGIRLKNVRISYSICLKERGRAHSSGLIEVRESDNALQLAGMVIHELAHQLVGVEAQHNEDWLEAAQALGLTIAAAAASGQVYESSHFAPDVLASILEALASLQAERPELFYDPNLDIPFPPGREPMPFQVDGIRQMLRMRSNGKNILLSDEMGLGKTVQVMGFINATHPRKILIGCPNNIKLSWKRHFEEWCIWPDLLEELEVAHSNLYAFGDVVIMNYEAIAKFGDMLKSQEWDLVVFDEGHYLKNPSAKRSKAAFRIRGATAMVVTGTPIVNYPYEAFPLLHYLDRDNWPEYGRFEAQFGSKSSEKLGRNLGRLNSMLRATIMVRRVKKEVMKELPKKRRQIIEFEVPDNVRKLIESEKALWNDVAKGEAQLVEWANAMKNESKNGVEAEDDIDWASILLELKATKKYAFEEMARIAHDIGRAKLPFVKEHIENLLENREKVIVWGHHRDVLESIADHFKDSSTLLLGGNRDQSSATQLSADRFSEDDTCTVFVGQMSIAQGYSLKGSSTCIFVEEDWIPGVMTQAEDRAHGIGRGDSEAKSMLIQHLTFEDSMDTVKAQRAINKQKSIDRAIGSGKLN